jgi:hypothetical protein
VTLSELETRLREYAEGAITGAELQGTFAPVLAADPLDVERSESTPWDVAPDETRLFWRLLYLFESEGTGDDDEERRRLAGRIVRCMASTRSPASTFELLPLVVDEERFCAIVAKHERGVISRTGFLNVIAESGYPPHVKLWLEHAPADALGRLCKRLTAGEYAAAAAAMERRPD